MSDSAEEPEVHEWSAFYDDEGRTYYYNSTNGESSWEPPEKFNPPPPSEGDEGEANAAESDAGEPDAGEPEAIANKDEDPDPDPDEAAEPRSPKSGSAWVAYQDGEGREYYFNTETEETTWDRPADYVPSEPATDEVHGEPSSPTRLPSPGAMEEQPATPEEEVPAEEADLEVEEMQVKEEEEEEEE
eukprot:CAMPEP_0117076354 /NCGR_PEP_ID=MMETSP0472-20121206/53812_1 /TAXON_ID=693140 ORGANISM="Tiarina fusus, Strain LIS" /NCGR_SAMPLE_ID=MMETSP0472 /ASSEMBLY_ACC=CAM_ASM_000603 /LENGTH=186 /DNA_ID=CAMNT_0004802195 /DNA_START=141 /DNA_END=698 /DNA_ORIENTATION=+